MDKNSYGKILRKLLTFSDVKFLVLANYLGYDVSYISKWCNGKKLPTEKSIEGINNNISVYLASEIFEQKKVSDFLRKFNVDKDEKEITNTILENIINEILEKNYKDCFKKEKSESKIFLNREAIKKDFINRLANILSDKDDKVEICICLDIISKDCEFIFSKILQYKAPNTKININVGIDLARIEKKDFTYLQKIYLVMNKFSELNINLYDMKDIGHLNFIIIENKIGFLFSLDNSNRIRVMLEIKDVDELQRIFTIFKNSQTKNSLVLSFMDTETILKNLYRTKFYLGNNFNFFLSMGFEFFLPPSVLKNILEFAKENGYKDEDIYLVKKLIIAWDEAFEKASANFFVLKSSLMNYLQERKICVGNIEYIMSIEEIEEHYNYLKGIMQENKNIKFYLFDDESETRNIEFKISIFCNESHGYFKNVDELKNMEKAGIFVITNDTFLDGMNGMFRSLLDYKECKEYSFEAIDESWNKYKNIMLRLLELGN